MTPKSTPQLPHWAQDAHLGAIMANLERNLLPIWSHTSLKPIPKTSCLRAPRLIDGMWIVKKYKNYDVKWLCSGTFMARMRELKDTKGERLPHWAILGCGVRSLIFWPSCVGVVSFALVCVRMSVVFFFFFALLATMFHHWSENKKMSSAGRPSKYVSSHR